MTRTRTSLLAILATAALAACGAKSTPAPAAPDEPAPAADPEPVAAAPAPPAEPVEPAEPAPPAEPPPPDPAQIKADLLVAELAAYERAKPVFEKFCAHCHVQGGKKATKKRLAELDMTSYPFTGKHAHEMGEEMREVLGIGGGKPSMPEDKKGAVKGEDLALVAAWADAYDAAKAGGAHEDRPTGAGHEH